MDKNEKKKDGKRIEGHIHKERQKCEKQQKENK